MTNMIQPRRADYRRVGASSEPQALSAECTTYGGRRCAFPPHRAHLVWLNYLGSGNIALDENPVGLHRRCLGRRDDMISRKTGVIL